MAAQTAALSGGNPVRRDMLVGLIGANIQKSLAPALFADVCAAIDRRLYELVSLSTHLTTAGNHRFT